VFVWDHLAFVMGFPSADPYVLLSAVAASTRTLKVGVEVTPLPRRRPQVLALTLATLDVLSQGRLIFGAGLGGVPQEFSAFGEPDNPKRRAAMLDEGLDVLDGLLRGVLVDHSGKHYTVDGLTLAHTPIQEPRPPFWIGGESPPALRRAARWDGWVIGGIDSEGQMTKKPAELSDQIAVIQEHRTVETPFDVAITGCSDAGHSSVPKEYAGAGATWWLESLFGLRGSVEDMLTRVEAGPPK
jgi:alkanesulfonate monooxygenase SsuD/methylene tetrahydromethanopterin reductase-like flavin-dependent oxidoreductase (luciferase family)